jgi:acylphosphatase
MKNMNYKIEKLLHEGFSMKTLNTFTPIQINVLYERVKKETKEATTKTVTSTTYSPDEAKNKTFQGTTNIKADGSVVVTKEGEVTEKSVSKQQQKLMGLALSVKKGDTPKSKVSKKVQDMSKDMSKKDLEDFASTKHKGLPSKKETKETVKGLEESIMKLIENHLPPTTTKGELLNSIKKFNR